MKIVVDENIPFIKGLFEPYASVLYMPGGGISAGDVADADAMVIRTRTRCDKSLLAGSSVRVIATATIGFDHIDTAYCAGRDIAVSRAAGCNAYAVVQYVVAALIRMGLGPGCRVAVVGVGAVGGALCRVLDAAGFVTLPVDPPRAASEGSAVFYSVEEALGAADAVTLHVPLTFHGRYRTENMADDSFFGMFKRGALFINSSRGEVVDQAALIRALDCGRVSDAVIDVWRDEPRIDRDLLARVAISTPHIAGYSLQGKAMGTAMSVRAVAERFGFDRLYGWWPGGVERVDRSAGLSWRRICDMMPEYYDIDRDSDMLRRAPEDFEGLRNRYEYRREFF